MDRNKEGRIVGVILLAMTNSNPLRGRKVPKTLHPWLFPNVDCQNCPWLHADNDVLLNGAGKISPAVLDVRSFESQPLTQF